MICVNCDKEFDYGLEQCPYCGCHYPEVRGISQTQKIETKPIDIAAAEKQVNELIEAILMKGSMTDKDRSVILRTALKGGLDPDVVEIKLDAAVTKIQKKQLKENKNETVVSVTQKETGKIEEVPKVVDSPSKSVADAERKERKSVSSETNKVTQKEINSPMGESDNGNVEKKSLIRFCKKCGEKLAPNAKFCKKCGTKMT